jgi:hypothetical protein
LEKLISKDKIPFKEISLFREHMVTIHFDQESSSVLLKFQGNHYSFKTVAKEDEITDWYCALHWNYLPPPYREQYYQVKGTNNQIFNYYAR